MGNNPSSSTQHEAFKENLFDVIKQLQDPGYGDFRLIRFHGVQDKTNICLWKMISPIGSNGPRFDPGEFKKRISVKIPGVAENIIAEPARDGSHALDLIFEYSTESLELIISNRPLQESELWALYDFLAIVGQNFQKAGEHFYEICPRDILYIDGKMKLCSQYVYEKYAVGIMRHFNSISSHEQKKLHMKVLRHNIKRLGSFMIESALRRPTKIDPKNEMAIKEEAERMKEFYSSKLCNFAKRLALNHEGLIFQDLRPSEEILTKMETPSPGKPPAQLNRGVLPGPTQRVLGGNFMGGNNSGSGGKANPNFADQNFMGESGITNTVKAFEYDMRAPPANDAPFPVNPLMASGKLGGSQPNLKFTKPQKPLDKISDEK